MISTTGWLLLIFFIATTYIAIQPLIAPTALVFFMFAYLVYGTNFLNLTLQKYDTGGQQWPNYYWCLMSGLFAGQVTTIAVLIVKQGIQQVVAMWVLVAVTTGVSTVISGRYKRLASSIPLSTAQRIDHLETNGTKTVPRSLWYHNSLTRAPNYVGRKPQERLIREQNYNETSENEQDSLRESSAVIDADIEVFSYMLPVLEEPAEYPIPTDGHSYQPLE